VGEKSESKILAKFLDADIPVLLPFGDNQRYDLVVDDNGDFVRIQCKTARLKNGSFEFKTCSTNWHSGKKRGYVNEADVFAVYLRENDTVYIFDVNKCPKDTCAARISDKFRQQKTSRNAKDHEFIKGKKFTAY